MEKDVINLTTATRCIGLRVAQRILMSSPSGIAADIIPLESRSGRVHESE